ncbi:sigma-70 family RNA polymerase sigma factor [Paenibacillus sp. N1-5-1-14]|uniref:sigma-70 family RNA polymerase sigma factor n=1 Tax=Paenibacillus radicibacter TaxID=2972488 RepID=UPI00215991A2|nr:sigma-70 family RNA polymerase sigma factor [Paenibacillus radicibacter]MCR8643316.1 sigma-70 family RNA polymerase sigma factor [Paenibacillus radicibacter]
MNLDEVYRTYVNDVYRYLFSLSHNHYTAEDLVQETFYRAYVKLADYEISNIKAWLFKVAYHAFIDNERKYKRVILQDQVPEIEPNLHTPEKEVIDKEGLHTLLRMMDHLTMNEQHVVLLCDFHGLQYQETADILNLKLNTVRSHLLRGRKKMIKMVKERMNGDE